MKILQNPPFHMQFNNLHTCHYPKWVISIADTITIAIETHGLNNLKLWTSNFEGNTKDPLLSIINYTNRLLNYDMGGQLIINAPASMVV